MRRALALAAAAATLMTCGAEPSARPSPSTSVPASASPSWSPSPTPQVTAGVPAYVAVSVATGWRSPSAARAVDAPALEQPVRIDQWIAGMTPADKMGLIDRVDTQTLLGDTVQVLAVQGVWARVAVPDQKTPADSRGYPVWIPVDQLTATPPRDARETVVVVKPTAILRSLDETSTLRISFGTRLPVVGEASTTFEVALPAGPMLVDKSAVSAQELPQTGAALVSTARSFLGLQYLWGGTSGFGYDCSGFVYAVFKAHRVLLPRDAGPQALAGGPVAWNALQPGDLIFFAKVGAVYHVAIYAGHGLVIDSPSPGHPVEQVALATMPVIADYSGARRVLPPR